MFKSKASPSPPHDLPRCTAETMDAPSPFDHPLADVIIRSADGVDFRMFNIDLSRTFKCALSQPPSLQKNGLLVIRLEEDYGVLEILLRFCIPGLSPELHTLDDAVKIMVGARKYQMECASRVAERAFAELAETEPVKAYLLACQFRFAESVKYAALLCLRVPTSQIVSACDSKLDDATARNLVKLLGYRHKCQRLVVEYVSNWDHWGPDVASSGCPINRHRDPRGRESPSIPNWWAEYLRRLKGDLEDCTWEGILQESVATNIYLSHSCGNPCRMSPERLTAFLKKARRKVSSMIASVQFDP